VFTVRLALKRVLQEEPTRLGEFAGIIRSVLVTVRLSTLTVALGFILIVLCAVGLLCPWNRNKAI
jgi:hypothetical protein